MVPKLKMSTMRRCCSDISNQTGCKDERDYEGNINRLMDERGYESCPGLYSARQGDHAAMILEPSRSAQNSKNTANKEETFTISLDNVCRVIS